MTRWSFLLLTVSLAVPGSLPGQSDSATRRKDAAAQDAVQNMQGAPWHLDAVHYGKWLAGAGAIALTWLGAREHARSADARDDLVAICGSDQANCAVGANGNYLNPDAERYYEQSIQFDRRARARLLMGQAALLVAVGFFIVDLPYGDDKPENIPLAPLDVAVDPRSGNAQLGLRFDF